MDQGTKFFLSFKYSDTFWGTYIHTYMVGHCVTLGLRIVGIKKGEGSTIMSNLECNETCVFLSYIR